MDRVRALLISLATACVVVLGGFTTTAQAQFRGNLPPQPPMVGDFFDGGHTRVGIFDQVTYAFHTTGFILSGSPGDPNAVLGYEVNGGAPNDFFTTGTGIDQSGDGLPDTFAMTEPLPPNEVPTSPGPDFEYDGGTVVYTNSPVITHPVDGTFQDGEFWYADYSFSRDVEMIIGADSGGGGAGTRRIKVAENNSPLPQNRLIFDYRFFNDVMVAQADVNRYVNPPSTTTHAVANEIRSARTRSIPDVPR